jgi:hypothetical protein
MLIHSVPNQLSPEHYVKVEGGLDLRNLAGVSPIYIHPYMYYNEWRIPSSTVYTLQCFSNFNNQVIISQLHVLLSGKRQRK